MTGEEEEMVDQNSSHQFCNDLLDKESEQWHVPYEEIGEEAPEPVDDYSNEDVDEEIGQMEVSPDKYWVPECDVGMKPFVGRQFSKLAEGIECYKAYADTVGFDVRHSTSHSRGDVVVRKYMLCNKQGFRGESRGTGKRNRLTFRVGCIAKIVFKFVGNGGYVVCNFEERHTHRLVDKKSLQFLKSNRKLNDGHKKLVMSCSRASLGTGTTHRLFKELVGGYANVGPLASDFKNFKKDMMAYISVADAQMAIDKFVQRKELCRNFFFEYDKDNTQQLTRLFWADSTSRKNFAAFGDVVAFDSTYRTNKYSMVFAPFTGMDNNQKCVTFAGGLLMKEDVESYSWLFDCFKRAMGHDPLLIVTDQDPSMKIAIEQYFPNTRHRFCLWHITSKFTERIGSKRSDIKEVLTTLGRLVWSEDIEQHKFTERIRTTSIAESQNSLFKKFSNRQLTLVELLMHFDGAMDKQRHEQHKLNFKSATMSPTLKTPLEIERNTADVYTTTIFLDIQEEIYAASFFGELMSISDRRPNANFKVRDRSKRIHELQHRVADDYFSCSCKMFDRLGIPCQHMFVVFKFLGLEKIPKCMVMGRWTKDPYQKDMFTIDDEDGNQFAAIKEKEGLVKEMWSVLFSCIGLVQDDVDRLRDFTCTLQETQSKYTSHDDGEPSQAANNVHLVESYAGIPVPSEINLHPPEVAKNKGSGKRLKGGKEKAIEESHKRKRQCKRCKQYAGHDVRTCKVVL